MAAPSYFDCFTEAYNGQMPGDITKAIQPPLGELSSIAAIDGNGKLGQVCHLSKSTPLSSIARAQVNPEAFGHPCIPIAETTSSSGEKYLFCCPVSSFGETALTVKYAECKNLALTQSIRNTWIPIPGNGVDEGPLAQFILHEPLLLAEGLTTQKKSYVSVENGFWIERGNLPRWNPKGPVRKLTRDSLKQLQWAYAVAQHYRVTVGNPSRIRNKDFSPPASPTAVEAAPLLPANETVYYNYAPVGPAEAYYTYTMPVEYVPVYAPAMPFWRYPAADPAFQVGYPEVYSPAYGLNAGAAEFCPAVAVH